MATPHDGHRARLRARFRREGLEHFAEHEALELLLCYGRARGDVNPAAHALIEAFGTLKGVLEASPEQLMAVSGVGEETATLISLMVPLFRRYQLSQAGRLIRLDSAAAAADYCTALLTGWRTERFYVLCLDSSHTLINLMLIAEGTLTEVAAYPRLVAETALNSNAAGLILCHNHPGGLCEPSEADRHLTGRLQAVLEALDIILLDHVICADGGAYSMAAHGDLRGKDPT